jgi:hypothetical protein
MKIYESFAFLYTSQYRRFIAAAVVMIWPVEELFDASF